ncbi:Hypothetical predicted protein, partial [Paramuricea clavata]
LDKHPTNNRTVLIQGTSDYCCDNLGNQQIIYVIVTDKTWPCVMASTSTDDNLDLSSLDQKDEIRFCDVMGQVLGFLRGVLIKQNDYITSWRRFMIQLVEKLDALSSVYTVPVACFQIYGNNNMPCHAGSKGGRNVIFTDECSGSLHKSHLAVDFLKNEKVIYWPTPPESPDLNPIECVWHEMKHYLRKYAKPKTKAELEQGIYDFWTTMTAAKCSKYIGHLEKLFLK